MQDWMPIESRSLWLELAKELKNLLLDAGISAPRDDLVLAPRGLESQAIVIRGLARVPW